MNGDRGDSGSGGGEAQQAQRQKKMKHEREPLEYDVYRDSLLRYLGYTNELGEAFKQFIPRSWYISSYCVASAYALADASHKGQLEYEHSTQEHIPRDPRLAAAGAVLDTAIWQGLASVAIPGFTINRIVAATRIATARMRTAHPMARFIPTVVGLSAIPFIIKPIDKLVDTLMDTAIRPPLFSAVEAMSSKLNNTNNNSSSSSTEEERGTNRDK